MSATTTEDVMTKLNYANATRTQQRQANSVLRRARTGSIATTIILGSVDRVVEKIRYGYRKYTTGEYVSMAYRNKFGWKNTYYQPALAVVEIAQ